MTRIAIATVLAVSVLLSWGVVAAGEATDRAYQAQWIWANVESPRPFQFVRFLKTMELDSVPAKAMNPWQEMLVIRGNTRVTVGPGTLVTR